MSKHPEQSKWYFKYVTQHLRQIFNWSPDRKKARLKAAAQKFNTYVCEICNGVFDRKDTHVDHRSPVVDPQVGFDGWDVYVERLFCDADNLQVLCVTCHKDKSRQEAVERKKTRERKKKSEKT